MKQGTIWHACKCGGPCVAPPKTPNKRRRRIKKKKTSAPTCNTATQKCRTANKLQKHARTLTSAGVRSLARKPAGRMCMGGSGPAASVYRSGSNR